MGQGPYRVGGTERRRLNRQHISFTTDSLLFKDGLADDEPRTRLGTLG